MSAGPRADDAGEPGPYVITFAASFERMPLAVPFLHELEHFCAFRSHSIERGRSVFRLHVGYFDSQEAARAALRVVRRHYTDAHIATAPHRDLGSLDDTAVTEFSMARPAPATAARPRDDADAAADESRCTTAMQRYAIQLGALARAESSAGAAELEVFRAHTLYWIYVLLDGVLHEALRLGFFPSVDAAQRVLVPVRDLYPQAILVPVSGREYARVRGLLPGGGREVPAAGAGDARSGAGDGRASDDDVSCEFGAHELPSVERPATRHAPRR